MTYLLGLTGSIGMGKSTTAQMFRDEGVPVWDADAAVHTLYAKGGAAVPVFAKELPQAIVDGAVDRGKLKQLLIDKPETIKVIEGIVHPLVAQHRAEFLRDQSALLVVMDIPLLYETGADDWSCPRQKMCNATGYLPVVRCQKRCSSKSSHAR